MDPNQQTPAPVPEQTPTPNPETAPVQQPVQPATQFGAPQPPNQQPPKKLGTGAIIAIVGGVILLIALIIGIAVAANVMTTKSNTGTGKNNDTQKTDDSSAAKRTPITASMPVSLRVVCIGGSVKNATTFKKPYNYVLFDNNNIYKDPSARKDTLVPFEDGDEWFLFGVGSSDEASTIDSGSDPSLFNAVICLDRDDSTAVKVMTCELNRSSGMKDTDSRMADYSSVKYKVTTYEAQTGKKISDLGTINGPAKECPSDKYFNKEAPGIYGDPDIDELNVKLKAFDEQ